MLGRGLIQGYGTMREFSDRKPSVRPLARGCVQPCENSHRLQKSDMVIWYCLRIEQRRLRDGLHI